MQTAPQNSKVSLAQVSNIFCVTGSHSLKLAGAISWQETGLNSTVSPLLFLSAPPFHSPLSSLLLEGQLTHARGLNWSLTQTFWNYEDHMKLGQGFRATGSPPPHQTFSHSVAEILGRMWDCFTFTSSFCNPDLNLGSKVPALTTLNKGSRRSQDQTCIGERDSEHVNLEPL